jgi:hypothetical protein
MWDSMWIMGRSIVDRLGSGLQPTEGDVDDASLKVLACNMRRALRAPEECDIPYLLETAARELDRLRIAAGAADELDRLNRRVADQIRWANDRACEAEKHDDQAGKEAWYGYVNALRWIQTLLPAEPSPAHDKSRDAAIDAKKHLEQECRVTEEMLERRATI